MHLTESHMYAFTRITQCMHLPESHMYALKDHTYAFNRIASVGI